MRDDLTGWADGWLDGTGSMESWGLDGRGERAWALGRLDEHLALIDTCLR